MRIERVIVKYFVEIVCGATLWGKFSWLMPKTKKYSCMFHQDTARAQPSNIISTFYQCKVIVQKLKLNSLIILGDISLTDFIL